MPVTQHSHVSVSEQLKNVRYILSVADQPLVGTTIDQLADERRRSSSSVSAIERRAASPPIALRKAAERVLPSFGGDFTNPELRSRMIETGYTFKAKNSRDALGHLLNRLIGEGRIKLVKKGQGGKPSIYRVIVKN